MAAVSWDQLSTWQWQWQDVSGPAVSGVTCFPRTESSKFALLLSVCQTENGININTMATLKHQTTSSSSTTQIFFLSHNINSNWHISLSPVALFITFSVNHCKLEFFPPYTVFLTTRRTLWTSAVFSSARSYSLKPPVLLVAWVKTGKSHITLTIQITKINYVFPVAVHASNSF